VLVAEFARRRGGGRAGAAIVLAGSLLFPAAWTLRNYSQNGVATLSNAYTFNLYLLSASKVKARAEGTTQAAAFEAIVGATVAELHRRGPGQWAQALRAAGGPTLAAHPGAAVVEAGRGLVEMLLAGERRTILRMTGSDRGADERPGINQGRRDVRSAVEYLGAAGGAEAVIVLGQLLVNAALAGLFVAGVWRLARRGAGPEAFLLGALVVYFLAGSITVASSRMRVPAAFLIDLGAGVALAGGWPASVSALVFRRRRV
jgi:hypothetical protein